MYIYNPTSSFEVTIPDTNIKGMYSIDKMTLLFTYDFCNDREVRSRLEKLSPSLSEFTYNSFYYIKHCYKPTIKLQGFYVEVGLYSEKSMKQVLEEEIETIEEDNVYSHIDVKQIRQKMCPVAYAKIDYNPNKISDSDLKLVIKLFKKDSMDCQIMKYDVALDLPVNKNCVRVLGNRRVCLRYDNDTQVYGKESHHNYLKVYDKQKEVMKKRKEEIPITTRIELTCVPHKTKTEFIKFPTQTEKIYLKYSDNIDNMMPSEKYKYYTANYLYDLGINPLDIAKQCGMSPRDIKKLSETIMGNSTEITFDRDIIYNLILQHFISINLTNYIINYFN